MRITSWIIGAAVAVAIVWERHRRAERRRWELFHSELEWRGTDEDY